MAVVAHDMTVDKAESEAQIAHHRPEERQIDLAAMRMAAAQEACRFCASVLRRNNDRRLIGDRRRGNY
jgi:hypothetical protein